MGKIHRDVAKQLLIRESHNWWGDVEQALLNRARDLDHDVTPEELKKLMRVVES